MAERPPIFFYAFDLLRVNRENATQLPLVERKRLLKHWISGKAGIVRFSHSSKADFEKLLRKAEELKLEGLMAKRPQSRYEPGERSGAWVKIKLVQEQAFVIGGFTDPSGGRLRCGIGVAIMHRDKAPQ